MYTGVLAFCGTSLWSTSKSWQIPFQSIPSEREGETCGIYSGIGSTGKDIPKRQWLLCRSSLQESQMPSSYRGLQAVIRRIVCTLHVRPGVQCRHSGLHPLRAGPLAPDLHTLPTWGGSCLTLGTFPSRLCDSTEQVTKYFC